MEEKPFKALSKSSGYHGSSKSNPHSDIRNLWTTATLSQPELNVQLSVYEDSEPEGNSETCEWYTRKKAGQDSVSGSEEWDDRDDISSFEPEELDDHTLSDLELRPRSSEGSHLEEDDDDSRTEMETYSSTPSLNIVKHTPHRAYWVEQQTRLPLPLVELMENEALKILTNALQSYQSEVGRNHFLTKQLQRYIAGLKRRRYKRLHVSVC